MEQNLRKNSVWYPNKNMKFIYLFNLGKISANKQKANSKINNCTNKIHIISNFCHFFLSFIEGRGEKKKYIDSEYVNF